MRTTTGKAALDRVLSGDLVLAEALEDALASDGEVDRATHGFHTYPAGLHPDAARSLMALFPQGPVLDPFCGGGTVLVEAVLAGRPALGLDVSPTAIRVANLRTRLLDETVLSAFRAASRKITDVARRATTPPPDPILTVVRDWYEPHVLAELEALRQGIAASPKEVRALLEGVFSSVLVKASFRRSDTSAQRIKTHRPKGTTAILFHKKSRELARRLAALRDEAAPGATEPEIVRRDCRRGPPRGGFGLALTSPPYPSTYDYVPLQHLRHVWLGGEAGADDEIGSRRAWRQGEREARRQWVEDTDAWTRAAAAALVPGGYLVVVIGDGLTPAGRVDSAEPTSAAAIRAGLVEVARASLARQDHAREDARWEHVFAFRRPERGEASRG